MPPVGLETLYRTFDFKSSYLEIIILDTNGVLAYLIPFSIFRNKFAGALREIIKPGLEKVIDFQGKPVFPKVSVTASIIVCKNNKEKEGIIYHTYSDGKKTNICKSALSKKWVFKNTTSNKAHRFGDYYSVSNSVATLFNNAFLFFPANEDERYFYTSDGYAIEKGTVYNAISAKSFRKRKNGYNQKIIVPYQLVQNAYHRYSEKEYSKRYPKAYEYLLQFYSQLINRSKLDHQLWFEFGRTQGLSSLIGEKLVVPMVATNGYTVINAGQEDVPYAGYFIKVKDGANKTLQEAEEIMQSEEFYSYIKEYGTPTTKNSFRISVWDIANYSIE